MELTKGDSLEGSAYTPMYNPHIIPLNLNVPVMNIEQPSIFDDS